jgi:hypothetical protein
MEMTHLNNIFCLIEFFAHFVNLFFLADSITQCFHSFKGDMHFGKLVRSE